MLTGSPKPHFFRFASSHRRQVHRCSSFSALLHASSCCCHTPNHSRIALNHSFLYRESLHSSLIARAKLSSAMTLDAFDFLLLRVRCGCSRHDSFISSSNTKTPIKLDHSARSRFAEPAPVAKGKHHNKSIGVLCCTAVVARVVVAVVALHCGHISRIAVVTRAPLGSTFV